MKGTARWFRPEVGEVIEKGVHRLAKGIAESFGATAEVKFSRHAPATVNDEDATTLAVRAATATAGEAKVRHMSAPTMGGEDFAFMLESRPGAFIFMGNGDTAGLHHPEYDFNDDALPFGIAYWTTLVETALAP